MGTFRLNRWPCLPEGKHPSHSSCLENLTRNTMTSLPRWRKPQLRTFSSNFLNWLGLHIPYLRVHKKCTRWSRRCMPLVHGTNFLHYQSKRKSYKSLGWAKGAISGPKPWMGIFVEKPKMWAGLQPWSISISSFAQHTGVNVPNVPHYLKCSILRWMKNG